MENQINDGLPESSPSKITPMRGSSDRVQSSIHLLLTIAVSL